MKGAIQKLLDCVAYAEDQHTASGGEILEDMTEADFTEMRNIIHTMLVDGNDDELPEITADDLRDYQGR